MTRRSFSSPSQHAWNVALQDIQSSQKADEVYIKVRLAVEQHTSLLKREATVRIKVWLTKLDEETNNPVWKKNRNAYAKLLLAQLKQGQLRQPFTAAPSQGPLQTLPASLTYASSIARSGSMRSTIKSGMSVGSAEGSPAGLDQTAPRLEDYRGRHAAASPPHRSTSAGTATLIFDAQSSQQGASETDGIALATAAGASHALQPKRRSSLWGDESLSGKPLSKSNTMASQDLASLQSDGQQEQQQNMSQKPVSPRQQQSAVSWSGAQVQVSQQPSNTKARSPVSRHPSRLRQSGSALPHTHSGPSLDHQLSSTDDSSTDQEQHGHNHGQRWNQQPASMQHLQPREQRGIHTSPRTVDQYMSRAGVRSRCQQMGQGSNAEQPYAAKARILDLHDGCTLAEHEQALAYGWGHSSSSGRGHSPARGLWRDGQGGAEGCPGQSCSPRQGLKRSNQGRPGASLGGTQMRVVSRGHSSPNQSYGNDAIDLADESWQPTKLELQARLGASKERQLELEWRLQQAEQKIAQAQAKQISAEMQLQESDQLRSQEDQDQSRADQPRSHRIKKDLGKLIDKYEKRQYRWGSPTKAAFLAQLTPLEAYRDGVGSSSSQSSLDSFAEITAALQKPRHDSSQSLDLPRQPSDHVQANTGQHAAEQQSNFPGHPRSGVAAQQAQQRSGFPWPSRSQQETESLSGASSQQSLSCAGDQRDVHSHEHNAGRQQPSALEAVEASSGPTSFMQRLQDFRRGTDALRRQVGVSC